MHDWGRIRGMRESGGGGGRVSGSSGPEGSVPRVGGSVASGARASRVGCRKPVRRRAAGAARRGGMGFRIAAFLCCLVTAEVIAAPVETLTARSDHFRIVFASSPASVTGPERVDGRRFAKRVLVAAEDVLGSFDEELRQGLAYPIEIVLEPVSVDRLAKAEPEWNRIRLGMGRGGFPFSRGEGDWVRETLAHELAHVVMTRAFSPWPPNVGAELRVSPLTVDPAARLGGRVPLQPRMEGALNIPLSAAAPFFWQEGGAEFLAAEAGALQWTSARDMFLRMSVLEGLILSPDALQSAQGKEGLDFERGYNQGFAFFRFLRERYGDEAMKRIVKAARKRFHWSWVDVFEEGQGVSFDALYGYWKIWLEKRYADARSRAARAVAGMPMTFTMPAWASPDEDERRRWLALPLAERKAAREGDEPMRIYPRFSPDGRVLAFWSGGLVLKGTAEDRWPAFGARPLDPRQDLLALKRRRARILFIADVPRSAFAWSPDSARLVLPKARVHDGATSLFIVRIRNEDTGGAEVFDASTPDASAEIPNTRFARDPAWAPDGSTIAFVRAFAGVSSLWTIRPDGSDPIEWVRYADGSTIGHPSFSPDGMQLVFHLYRAGRRDLWILDLASGRLEPITLDAADDLDPTWAADGRIYFSSDRHPRAAPQASDDSLGVYNIHSVDPSTGEMRRLTDVIGGAFTPSLTPSGHLLFSYFDGYAFRIHGLKASERLAIPLEAAGFISSEAEIAAVLAPGAPIPALEGTRYRPRPTRRLLVPRISAGERRLRIGGRVLWTDPRERRRISIALDVGDGLDAALSLAAPAAPLRPMLDLWTASDLNQVVLRLSSQEGDTLLERSRTISEHGGRVGVGHALGSSVDVGVEGAFRLVGFRDGRSGSGVTPVHKRIGGGVSALFSSFAPDPDHRPGGIDPRDGLFLFVAWSVVRADADDPLTGGAVFDAGQALDAYTYHRIDGTLDTAISLPWSDHSVEGRIDLGWIDRNVAWWDELKAGGRLPWRPQGDFRHVAFPGYSSLSLSGETLGVASLDYRLPLAVNMASAWGPLYVDRVYLQVGTTVGQVWSYHAASDGTPVRESPFGPGPRRQALAGNAPPFLAEAGLEIRLLSSLFARYRWGGFARLSYALNAVSGLGDVDGDFIIPAIAPDEYGDLLPVAGGEGAPAGVRLALGLGVGF